MLQFYSSGYIHSMFYMENNLLQCLRRCCILATSTLITSSIKSLKMRRSMSNTTPGTSSQHFPQSSDFLFKSALTMFITSSSSSSSLYVHLLKPF
ncbi:hypothetical protein Hanom_Chr09g00826961 [Helianthus anomalus]